MISIFILSEVSFAVLPIRCDGAHRPVAPDEVLEAESACEANGQRVGIGSHNLQQE